MLCSIKKRKYLASSRGFAIILAPNTPLGVTVNMESIPVEKTAEYKLELGVIQANDRMLNDREKKKNWKLFIYVYFFVFTQP